MYSIRGATTVLCDEREEVLLKTEELLLKMIEKNSVNLKDVISVLFSCTRDIKSCYPAVAGRKLGLTKASIMCFNEMEVIDSLEKCIRVMILVNCDKDQDEVNFVYLNGAKKLRPDLLKEF